MTSSPTHYLAITRSIREIKRATFIVLGCGLLVSLIIMALALSGIERQKNEVERVRGEVTSLILDLEDLTVTLGQVARHERDVVIAAGRPSAAARAADAWRVELDRALATIDDLLARDLLERDLLDAIGAERAALSRYAEGAGPILDALVADENVNPDRAALALVPVASHIRDLEASVDATQHQVLMLDEQAARLAANEADSFRTRLLIVGGILIALWAGAGFFVWSKSKDSVDRLGDLSSTDPLTGLLNRSGLARAFAASQTRPTQTGATPVGLGAIHVNLDHFGLVNDVAGQSRGDELLVAVGDIISEVMSEATTTSTGGFEFTARVSGDEFVAVAGVREPADHEALVQRASAILNRIHTLTFRADEHIFPLTASIGVCLDRGADGTDHPDRLADLLAAAQRAQLVAEESGRDRVHVVAESDIEADPARRLLAEAGRAQRYLDNSRLRLDRHKILGLAGQGDRCELIVGAVDETRGRRVSGSSFVPAAERFGLIEAIDRWSLAAALLLIDSGYLDDVERASVKMSASSMADPEFAEFADRILADHGRAASRLCLEVDHGALASLPQVFEHYRDRFATHGTALVASGFGSRTGNLNLLERTELHAVRLSPSLVADIETSGSLVGALGEIAARRGLPVIAPGVGNHTDLGRLVELGVSFAQGPGVSAHEPIDAGELWRLATTTVDTVTSVGKA